MKYFLIAFLFFPVVLCGQDCTLKKDVDPFSQKPTLSTGFISLGAGSGHFLLSMDAVQKEINFFFNMKGGANGRCFGPESTATIMFDDGKSKFEVKNTGPENCDGVFQATFRNATITTTQLQKLSTKKVATLLITGNDKVSSIALTENDKVQLMNWAACIAKQAKALL